MPPSSNNKSQPPRRNSLPSSILQPPKHGLVAAAAQKQQRPSRHDFSRRSSLKDMSSTNTSTPWCSLLPPVVVPGLTPHQQSLVHQAQQAFKVQSIVALVGDHGMGKSALARELVLLDSISAETTILWLQADTEWTLRASYIAILRQYATTAALDTIATTNTTTQLAQQVATQVLEQRQSTNHKDWMIVYDQVGVPADQFFAQWSIPTTNNIKTIVTTCLTQYSHWQQDKYTSFVVEALPPTDARQILLSNNNSKEENEEMLTKLFWLLQGVPLALSMARAQWRQLEYSLVKYVDTLLDYQEQYSKDNTTTSTNTNLDWFWSFAIHHVWEMSYNREDYQKALQVASLLHHECLPSSVFEAHSSVLPQLQAWALLQPRTTTTGTMSSGTTYYSIPKDVQQAIRRRVDLTALSTTVEAVHGCMHHLADPIAFVPHLETLQANIDLLVGVYELPQGFPREDYAEVLLQTGLVLQHKMLDYPRAQTYFQQGLDMVLPDSTKKPSTNRQLKLVRSLHYRLGMVARFQQKSASPSSSTSTENVMAAQEHCGKALEMYGYKVEQFSSSSDVDTTNSDNDDMNHLQPLPKDLQQEDYNILSQLFHTCGHVAWKQRDLVLAKTYFQHELQVKQAWFGPNTPQERLARTLNNLSAVCRECGELPAARTYCEQSLEMQMALQQQLENNQKPTAAANLERATTINNLGALSYSMCDYTKAQHYFQQALDIKRQCYAAETAKVATDDDGKENSETTNPQNKDIAETLHNLGMLSDHLGDYETARSYYQESLDCKSAVYGKDPNADLATTLTSLGLLTMNHGKYTESREYYQQALDMQRAVYGDDGGNMEMVRTLHGLGILNYHLGKVQDSRQCHKEALEMQQSMERAEATAAAASNNKKRTFLADPRTANLSQIMQTLGNLNHNVGEYDEARDFYEQGLQLYSQVCANQAKDDQLKKLLGHLQSNLSSSETGYDAAQNYYEKALEMKYYVYGDEAKNSDLAFTLHSLALLNDNVGRYKESQEYYEKALDMLHHLYGGKKAKNGEIAGILHGLGTISFNRGKYAKSEWYFQKSLKMKETVYGGPDASNDDLATTHVSLGTLAHATGKYDEAKHHLERALEMQQQVYGNVGESDQNIELALTCNCLANLYRDLGQYDKASILYDRSANHLGEESDNPFLASMLTDCAELHRLTGDYDKAEACLTRAQELQHKLYGKDAENAEIAFTKTTLGKLYSSQGKHEEAKDILVQALKIQRHVYQNDEKEDETMAHGEVAETLEALGNLAHVRGDLVQSRVFLEEAEAMRNKAQGKDAITVEKARNLHALGDVAAEMGDEEAAQKFRDDSETMHDSIAELMADMSEEHDEMGQTTDETVGASAAEVPEESQEQAEGSESADEASVVYNKGEVAADAEVNEAKEREGENGDATAVAADELSDRDITASDPIKVDVDLDLVGPPSLPPPPPPRAKAVMIADQDDEQHVAEGESDKASKLKKEKSDKKLKKERSKKKLEKEISDKKLKKEKSKKKLEKEKSDKKLVEKEKSFKKEKSDKPFKKEKSDKKLEKEKSEKKLKKEKSKKKVKEPKEDSKETSRDDEEAKTAEMAKKHDSNSIAASNDDNTESSYHEQASGECSDEAWSDNKKKETESKGETSSMEGKTETQPASEATRSRGLLNFGDDDGSESLKLKGLKKSVTGAGPVTDMPPRPREAEEATCGCLPFLFRR